ncbi:MAG: hypothetical protein JXA15_07665 [Spirochaetales bacterium]|nr:hypothetical protein [Spirochaetales bacterium]
MTTLAVVLALNVTGLLAVFLYVRARLARVLDAEGLLADLRREVSALVSELNAEADRDVTLIEDRSEALRRLLDDAERRMGAMRREAATRNGERAVLDRLDAARAEAATRAAAASEAGAPSSWDPLLPRGAREAVASRPEETRREPEPARDRPPATRSAGVRVDATGAPARSEGASPELPFVSFSSAPLKGRPDFREEAISMWRKGFSSDLIAARLGATIAEVDLVVGLEEERGAEGGR